MSTRALLYSCLHLAEPWLGPDRPWLGAALRRLMSAPVHEVLDLPSAEDVPGGTPLPPPSDFDHCQALHLHATDDLLLGRSLAGSLWLWDLSERLGWADGSTAGTWLRPGACEGHMDETDFEAAPLPLGCIQPLYSGFEHAAGDWRTARPLQHCWRQPAAWVLPHCVVAMAGRPLPASHRQKARTAYHDADCLVVASLQPAT